MVKHTGIDRLLVFITIILLLFGLLMVYSSTMITAKENHNDSFHFLKRQLVYVVIGLLILFSIAWLKFPLYLDWRFIYLSILLSIALLVMVFFSSKINNTYRWLRFYGFSIQPSEFAKISVILYLSYIFGKKFEDVNNIRRTLVLLIPVIVIAVLIFKEPDYGNFFLVLFTTMLLLYIALLKYRYVIFTFILFVPLAVFMFKFSSLIQNRILAFLNPEAYASNISYQAMQSIYAIGSGGIFGQGIGRSTQKLFFLPYSNSDFIFSIIGEELGLMGALFVILLFSTIFIRGIHIARQSESRQTYLLVAGLSFLIVTQALLNISVSIGILPTTGIPLPIISSGGSSLLSSLIIIGIILNISRHRKMVFLDD